MTKPLKYLVRGLIINVGILFTVSLYLLVAIALNYKGRCGVFWVFGGDGRPCPFFEYMRQEVQFIFLPILFALWWLILLAFPLIPGIAYLIGRHRSEPAAPR